MSRKSFLLGMGTLVFLLAAVGASLTLVVRHPPRYYLRSEVPSGDVRTNHSREFCIEFVRLIEDIINKRQWQACFTEEQINSYFAEDFLRGGPEGLVLPEGMSDPRIAIEPDKMRLAFRYGVEPWATVVSIDLRVWLAPQEPNVVALELQAMHAGSLPISAQSILERVSEIVRQQKLDVTWYRHRANPVALVRFQPYQTRPTFQLQRLELHHGKLFIGGRSIDASPPAVLSAAVTP